MTSIWKAYCQASLILRVTIALVLGIVLLKMRQSERQHAMGERLYGGI